MNFSWSDVKEGFYAIGSIAGVIALLRPVVESKFQRDCERVTRILDLLNEQRVVELEYCLYQRRYVLASDFAPFNKLNSEIEENQSAVRFSGPFRKYIKKEIEELLAAYHDLRQLVQVPEWEQKSFKNEDGSFDEVWDFNKQAFFDSAINASRNYADHLKDASDCARRIKAAFQRLQIVSEVHLIELPIIGILLRKRFKENGL